MPALSDYPQIEADGAKVLGFRENQDGSRTTGLVDTAELGGVTSVHGRSGDVVAVAGDYTAEQIDDTGAKVIMTLAERQKLAAASVTLPSQQEITDEINDLRAMSPKAVADIARAKGSGGHTTLETLPDGETRVAVSPEARLKVLSLPLDVLGRVDVDVPGGVAGLDSNAKILAAALPSGEARTYLGVYEVPANVPTLQADGSGNAPGEYYVVSVAGTRFGSTFAVGDEIVLSAANVWERVPGSAVTSVNGHAGVVVLDADDVGATPAAHVGAGETAHALANDEDNGFMSAGEHTKLADIEEYAQANPQQVSASEITAGTEPGVRLWSPADMLSFAGQHGGTGTPSDDSVTTAKLQNGAVTLAKVQQIATASLMGRVDASTGIIQVLTPAQVRTLLNVADGAQVNPPAGSDALISAGEDATMRSWSAAHLALAAQTWGGGSGGGMKVPLVDLTALKAQAKPTGFDVRVVTDGRAGGVWRWDVNSTETADDATVVAANAGGAGRWLRCGTGALVDARWFGCACDGVTNDTTALLAARAYALARPNGPGTVYVPGSIVLGTCDLSNINLTVAGWIKTAVGVTITIGGSASAPKTVTYDIPCISDGAETMSTRATPQLRVVGNNARIRTECGYVQLYADGNTAAIATCANNEIDLVQCYLVHILDINSGYIKFNRVLGKITQLLCAGTVHHFNNIIRTVIEGGAIDFQKGSYNTVYSPLVSMGGINHAAGTVSNRIVREYDTSGKADRDYRPYAGTITDSGWGNTLSRENPSYMAVWVLKAVPPCTAAAAGTVIGEVTISAVPGDMILIDVGDSAVWRPLVQLLDVNKAVLTNAIGDLITVDSTQNWAWSAGVSGYSMGTTMSASLRQVLQIRRDVTSVKYVRLVAKVNTSGGPFTSTLGLTFSVARAPQDQAPLLAA